MHISEIKDIIINIRSDFEHDNQELVNWGEKVNTVCTIKVGDPTEIHTHYLLLANLVIVCTFRFNKRRTA